jgi:hypothetical protein
MTCGKEESTKKGHKEKRTWHPQNGKNKNHFCSISVFLQYHVITTIINVYNNGNNTETVEESST